MRRISFALTTQAVRERRKTVTRRLGWSFAHVGDRHLAVDKLRTKSAEILGVIEVVSVRVEPLYDLLRAADGFGCDGGDENAYALTEMEKEGFPGMKPLDFVSLFTKGNKGNGLSPYANNVDVRRIEFRYPCFYCNESVLSIYAGLLLTNNVWVHASCNEDALASGAYV